MQVLFKKVEVKIENRFFAQNVNQRLQIFN